MIKYLKKNKEKIKMTKNNWYFEILDFIYLQSCVLYISFHFNNYTIFFLIVLPRSLVQCWIIIIKEFFCHIPNLNSQ